MNDPSRVDVDVLIVGAGPVGLALACELTRHGVRCRIVDGNDGPTPINESRALGLQARTLEVFRDMGVIDPVLAEARPIHGIGAYSAGRRVFHFGFDLADLDTRYPFILALKQSRTERLLIDRLRSLGVEVERGMALESFAEEGNGVAATFASGTIRVPWLVGCDGSRSVVRKGLGLAFEGGEYEERFLIADVHLDWSKPTDEVTITLTPDGPFVAFPFPEPGRWRLVDTSGKVDVTEPGAIVDRFRELVQTHAEPGATVDDPSWTSSFHIHRRVVDRYRAGRCFVAGDAAHLHSPAGGQGMNTGIQDAYNLAWKLALVVKGRGKEALLDSYSSERRPIAVGVLKGSDRATRMVTLRGELAQGLRNRLLGVLTEFDFVRKKISVGVSELDINYRESPIVAEHHAGLADFIGRDGPGLRGYLDFASGPRPGDRTPDILLGHDGPARLHDALAPTIHTLLVFEATGPRDASIDGRITAVASLVAERYADLICPILVRRTAEAPEGWPGSILADPDGILHDRFGARSDCLYLIRPDGHVGYRCQPVDADYLDTYLKSFLV